MDEYENQHYSDKGGHHERGQYHQQVRKGNLPDPNTEWIEWVDAIAALGNWDQQLEELGLRRT